MTGVISRWILTINSKAPVSTQVMSNGYLTASAIEPQARERIIYGIGDEQGKISPICFGLVFCLLKSFEKVVTQLLLDVIKIVGAFRLFYVDHFSQTQVAILSKAMKDFLDREVNRKNVFLNWQVCSVNFVSVQLKPIQILIGEL